MEYLTFKNLKKALWETKLTPREWNAFLNHAADKLPATAQDLEAGYKPATGADRFASAIFKGLVYGTSFMCAVGAEMSGGRKRDIDISEVERKKHEPSPINVWSNRLADECRRSAVLAHRRNKTVIEKVEPATGITKPVVEAEALGSSMFSGLIMAVSLNTEMLAHGVAKLTGGRKPNLYSRPAA